MLELKVLRLFDNTVLLILYLASSNLFSDLVCLVKGFYIRGILVYLTSSDLFPVRFVRSQMATTVICLSLFYPVINL